MDWNGQMYHARLQPFLYLMNPVYDITKFNTESVWNIHYSLFQVSKEKRANIYREI